MAREGNVMFVVPPKFGWLVPLCRLWLLRGFIKPLPGVFPGHHWNFCPPYPDTSSKFRYQVAAPKVPKNSLKLVKDGMEGAICNFLLISNQ